MSSAVYSARRTIRKKPPPSAISPLSSDGIHGRTATTRHDTQHLVASPNIWVPFSFFVVHHRPTRTEPSESESTNGRTFLRSENGGVFFAMGGGGHFTHVFSFVFQYIHYFFVLEWFNIRFTIAVCLPRGHPLTPRPVLGVSWSFFLNSLYVTSGWREKSRDVVCSFSFLPEKKMVAGTSKDLRRIPTDPNRPRSPENNNNWSMKSSHILWGLLGSFRDGPFSDQSNWQRPVWKLETNRRPNAGERFIFTACSSRYLARSTHRQHGESRLISTLSGLGRIHAALISPQSELPAGEARICRECESASSAS